MNRRSFIANGISCVAIGSFGLPVFAKAIGNSFENLQYPPYLIHGNTIGITCPANPVKVIEIRNALKAIENWGMQVKLGNNLGKTWQRFAGTDAERASDLQSMLDDPSINAILFARGGYGTMRMMEKLDWSSFKKSPKWLVGYSDITALHCHIHSTMAIATIHADMAGGFDPFENDGQRTLKETLMGRKQKYLITPHSLNKPGSCDGVLIGGNLSMIYAMQGSPSQLKTEGKILFIEDVSEYKYTIDRMLMNLKRAGQLSNLAGLVVGGFTATKEDGETSFQMSIEEIILEKVGMYNYPVCLNFPAGHLSRNLALKLGAPYHLEVARNQVVFEEKDSISAILPAPPLADSVIVNDHFSPNL